MPIKKYIKEQLSKKPILLMTHCVVGYPSLDANWEMLEAFAAADVDFVELQLPFSEPMADGPVFVKANEKALNNGITPELYFEFMQKVTSTFSFKVYFMGYYNSVFKMGHKTFCKRLAAAGGQGFIIPDLPIEEYQDLFDYTKQYDLDPVMFFTPLNSTERLQKIAQKAHGFIYCIPRKGVTGTQSDTRHINELLGTYRKYAGNTAIAVGFGITKPEDIHNLIGKTDIAIVGTQLLRQWESGNPADFRNFIKSLTVI